MDRLRVGDIRKSITQNPTIAYETDSLVKVAEKIVEDPKTRAVYVLNSQDELVGIIPVIELIQYIYYEYIPTEYITYRFPLALSCEPKANDIMLPPVYVKDDDPIKIAFRKMFKENLKELPVVDDNMHVIGDLNILELIVAWLEMNKHAP